VPRLLLILIACGLPAGCAQEVGAPRPVAGGMRCAGSGSPSVILEAGLGAGVLAWLDVQPQVAEFTRTCAYDRASPPGISDADDSIADLRRRLARAGVKPPYVLVGHSYGGVLARVFAQAEPEQTAGLVLVDTMGRDGRARQLAVWPATQAPERRAGLAATVLDGVDLTPGETRASEIASLGELPLAIVTAGRQTAFPRSPTRLNRALNRLWTRMQDELARLSTNSVHVVATRSQHDVASAIAGQPAVVIRAVRAVVEAARDGSRLPPCRQLFYGADVSCRD
jgi:pimeloyl-ACP methyl ester carboxylesterase